MTELEALAGSITVRASSCRRRRCSRCGRWVEVFRTAGLGRYVVITSKSSYTTRRVDGVLWQVFEARSVHGCTRGGREG